jgi:hypothetical protein
MTEKFTVGYICEIYQHLRDKGHQLRENVMLLEGEQEGLKQERG